MEITIQQEAWPIAGAFTVSRGSKTEAVVVTVTASQDGKTGRGECVPYARYGETPENVIEAIKVAIPSIKRPEDHALVADLLPSGAARNALDCALWDLEAKLSGRRVWDILGCPAPKPVATAYTISLDTPEAMQAKATEHRHRPLLKLKLAGDGDLERVAAVRAGAPDAALIVDANEGWHPSHYDALVSDFLALGVTAIEQPFPEGADEALGTLDRPIPVIADESCHTSADLARLHALYDGINIKLDKTGGLTEALRLQKAARDLDMKIMVGCMVATSLAMAPALLLAAGADWVDLDGPLLLEKDRTPGLVFSTSIISPPQPALWG